MQRIIFKLSLICINNLFLFSSFTYSQSTSIEDEQYKFNRINLKLHCELSITVGPTQTIKVLASDKILGLMKFEILDKELTIKYKRSFQSIPAQGSDINIIITLPELLGITLDSKGIINAYNVSAPDFYCKVKNSGMVQTVLKGENNAFYSISGNGKVKISGKMDSLSVEIDGSGIVDASELKNKFLFAEISGSGEIISNNVIIPKAKIRDSGRIKIQDN